MTNTQFDIIIAGGGLSGLSLAWYLIDKDYKGEVLIIDSTFAPNNNKTWCFWDKTIPPFYEIVFKKWRKTFFSVLDFDAFLYMQKYAYYCLRESDFKEYVLRKIQEKSNFHLLEESILDFSSDTDKAVLVTKESNTYHADYIFQSVLTPNEADSRNLKYPLIQHFYGIEIITNSTLFDPETFTMMDFDESYTDAPAFFYVLPFAHNEALIEFTIFSEHPLRTKKEYKEKLKSYLKEKYGLGKSDYRIVRKEYGEIPMDDRPYVPKHDHKIINIGTVGGLTKPSTGYTFSRIQEYTQKLAESIIEGKAPIYPTRSKLRYRYYDLLLLHVLATSTEESLIVFRDLFKKHSIDTIFDFLSEKTSFTQDLKIMNSMKYAPFLKAIIKNL